MIKDITNLCCEFCNEIFTVQEAIDLGDLCNKCPEGKAEKIFKERLTKLEADFQIAKANLKQQYEDWLANH